jgi:hypothetical protein
VNNEATQTSELFKYQSRAFFRKIVTTRYWNARHGGVYVPITAETQSNPYLDVPDRDIVTKNGLKLTKINPAYMTRQIGEIAVQKNSELIIAGDGEKRFRYMAPLRVEAPCLKCHAKQGYKEGDLAEIIFQLQHALGEVKTLKGFLSICAYCKNIRDDKGYWKKIETYIHDHSEAEFSHGICPECAQKHFPDFDIDND